MSSNIEVYEDKRISLDFELKSGAVWLYVHEAFEEDQADWVTLRTEALSVKDLDQMISAFQAARDFKANIERFHDGRTKESDT